MIHISTPFFSIRQVGIMQTPHQTEMQLHGKKTGKLYRLQISTVWLLDMLTQRVIRRNTQKLMEAFWGNQN